jgi:hypothetical protein
MNKIRKLIRAAKIKELINIVAFKNVLIDPECFVA